MLSSENISSLNNSESTSSETEYVSSGVENEVSQETIDEIDGLDTKEDELTQTEKLDNLEKEIKVSQQEVVVLEESIQNTKAQLNDVREKLGLPPTVEEPPSILSDKEKIEGLKDKQEILEKNKEDFVNEQEKEQLIQQEKEEILQEKIDELFEKFNGLAPRDLESILKSGKTSNGENVESKFMGSLEPAVAKSLAHAFKDGIKLLPKLIEILPEMMKKFDKELTNEATKRVEQKLEEQKQVLEETSEEKEQPKLQEDEAVINENTSDNTSDSGETNSDQNTVV